VKPLSGTPFEQRNPYKGVPPRPWVRVRFAAPGGSTIELDLLADTGNPFAVIVSQQDMAVLKAGDAPDANSNLGLLQGGWLQPDMPELALVQPVVGYASDPVVAGAAASHADFAGLAGLPLLGLAEYGGDGNWFWLHAGSPAV
jgi:hypothetical protein